MRDQNTLKTTVIAVFALTTTLASAWADPPSRSKIGIHLIGDNTTGVRQISAAHPRVIKLLDTSRQMLEAAREYKKSTPMGIVVLRIYTGQPRYKLSDKPADKAAEFFKNVLAGPLEQLSPVDRKRIDYLEGPNECDSTPCWGSLEEAKWNNDFWVALAPLIAKAGYKPCAFCIPVGNPPGTQEEMLARIEALVPALRSVKALGGAWSYHAYTPKYSTELNYQLSYSLRYRRFYKLFADKYPDLADMPLIITEAGFDTGGNPQKSGWRANGSARQFQDWLMWWDDQLAKDDYVLGSTLFQIGSPGSWPSFDVEPIAPWLADYLKNSGPATPSTRPAKKR